MGDRETIVMLVGSGAVENAWAPVIRALRGTGFTDVRTSQGANFALARLVYMARTAKLWKDVTEDQRVILLGILETAKKAIADEISKAQTAGELRVRPQFSEVVRHFVADISPPPWAGIVCTNWDECVKRAVERLLPGIPFTHMHGHVGNSGQIYLPTEIAAEPYRSSVDLAEFEQIHGDFVRALDGATSVVVYGLALSPLDAEIATHLHAGITNSKVKAIHIVDPNYPEVAERLVLAAPEQDVRPQIYGYLPGDLGTRWSFSADDIEAEKDRIATGRR